MTSTWLDDTDVESAEYDDSESDELFGDSDLDSGDFDSESDDAESRSAAARRRRARQRRAALARRRQAVARARARGLARRASAPRPSPQRATASAIRNLDLETKVQEDTFRGAIAAQNKRMSRSEYAAVVGAAVNQFIDSFDAPDNPYAKAALRFSPLLLLSPQKKGTGVEGFIKDPRVIGAALVGGITVFGESRNQFRRAKKISVDVPPSLPQGTKLTLSGDVLGGNDTILNENVRWEVSDTEVATINAESGDLVAVKQGFVTITARFGDIKKTAYLQVTPAAGGAR